jgi:hypothetical protein
VKLVALDGVVRDTYALWAQWSWAHPLLDSNLAPHTVLEINSRVLCMLGRALPVS